MRPDTDVEDDASIMEIILQAHCFDKILISVTVMYFTCIFFLACALKRDLKNSSQLSGWPVNIAASVAPNPSWLAFTTLSVRSQKQRSNRNLHSLQLRSSLFASFRVGALHTRSSCHSQLPLLPNTFKTCLLIAKKVLVVEHQKSASMDRHHLQC